MLRAYICDPHIPRAPALEQLMNRRQLQNHVNVNPTGDVRVILAPFSERIMGNVEAALRELGYRDARDPESDPHAGGTPVTWKRWVTGGAA